MSNLETKPYAAGDDRPVRDRIIGFAALTFAFLLSVAILAFVAGTVSRFLIPVSAPPTSADPRLVLDAYLRTLVAGDCETGRMFWAAGALENGGDLCGATSVWSYRIDGEPATPPDGEIVFSTHLTTTGSDDGSVRPGEIIWFYALREQVDGAWRLVGGGSGP